MAGKKGKKNGRRKQKIPIAATAGMLIGLKNLWDAYQAGGTGRAMRALTGYENGIFNWKNASAIIPMAGGAIVSMAASKTGLNRYVKIPMFKI